MAIEGALADLCARIRGEYLEMPGLALTFAQAVRLWNEEPTVCRRTLDVLVASGFLHSSGGMYLRSDAGQRTA